MESQPSSSRNPWASSIIRFEILSKSTRGQGEQTKKVSFFPPKIDSTPKFKRRMELAVVLVNPSWVWGLAALKFKYFQKWIKSLIKAGSTKHMRDIMTVRSGWHRWLLKVPLTACAHFAFCSTLKLSLTARLGELETWCLWRKIANPTFTDASMAKSFLSI